MAFIRNTIEITNRLLASARSGSRHRLPRREYPVKVNIGCGLAVAPGLLNIDGSLNSLIANLPRFTHGWAYQVAGARLYYTKEEYCRILSSNRFIHQDLSKGIPLEDGTADFIFSSHFLEHLFREDATFLLRECFRVMKSGAVLRISVPDLSYAISLYAAGEKEKMLRDYFFVEDGDSFYSRHKYMYDYEILSGNLHLIGFSCIRKCEYRSGLVPDLHILDNRPEESLFVEASKP